jgi:cytochrome c oxidase subunit 3/cytochrome o ubiquinol oxidase subunit 3
MLGMTFLAFQVFEFRDFANHELEFHCSEVDLGAGAIVADDHTLTGFQRGQLREQCEAGNEEAVVDHGLTPRTNLFGTTFFTLTGFHGAHVTLGVIWLLSLFFYSFKKDGATPQRGLDVDLAALYWHFVDVVWIVIFTVVYLFGVFPGI